MEYFAIREEASSVGRLVGQLGLVMNDQNVVHKRHEILVQLALSLLLIGAVLVVTGRLLRARLIAPIGRIGDAM